MSDHFNIANIPKIQVIIRKRPLTKKELRKNDTDIAEVRDNNTIIIKELRTKVDLTKYTEHHNFCFDGAYDEHSENIDIYNGAVKPLVYAAFNGSKVTCFAYGQTGSGKTYTMMGNVSKEGVAASPGLYLLAAREIFSYLESSDYHHLRASISFYEIYCGKAHD